VEPAWIQFCRRPVSVDQQWHAPCCGRPGVVSLLCLSHAEPVGHGLSQSAVEIARIFAFPITNSMIVTWIVALGLIVFAQLATRRIAQVPGGAQNALEWLLESLYQMLEGIIGHHLVERTFWFFATIFIFIIAANWIGLVPGVGTIGWGHQTAHGFVIDRPLFRGANADLNMTLAMALVFFACWIYWALQEVGARGVVKELFAPKGETTGPLKVVMMAVFVAAGCFAPCRLAFVSTATRSRERRCWRPWRPSCRDSGGCCLCPSTSWSCWSASFRRWSSCC
jgi:F0F1-type ATP synthase membrane subunit a